MVEAKDEKAAPISPRPVGKPEFVFRGLSYLYHIEECRVSPIGFDRQGIKYIEIIDVVDNKQFFTAEITSLKEDIIVKDKYGIVRFCIHGWNGIGQLDTYVNIKKPIGIVKDQVFYDHHKIPIYVANRTNIGTLNCFGPPTFRISTVLKNRDIGYITPEPTSMHLKFDQFIDEGPKALLLAYSIQIALSKYKMLNLNLQKVKYIYKDRSKAKAKKEAQKGKNSIPSVPPASAGPPNVIYQPVPVAVPQPILIPAPQPAPPSQPQVVFIQPPSGASVTKAPPPTEVKVIMPPPPPQPKPEILPPPPPTVPHPPPGNGEPSLVLISVKKTKVPSESRRSSTLSSIVHSRKASSSNPQAVPDPSVNPVEDPNVVEEIIEENKKVTNLDGTVTKYHTETRRSVTPSVAEQNAIASSLNSVHQSKRPSEIIDWDKLSGRLLTSAQPTPSSSQPGTRRSSRKSSSKSSNVLD